METRRIRRHQQRRVRRTAVMATLTVVIGIAVGTTLPRSTTVSATLVAVAACGLVVGAVRDPSLAPLHGLHRVVRLPLRKSVAVTLDSFTSRLVGTARATIPRRPRPTPIVIDEADDEAEAWWGATSTPAPPAAAPPARAPWPPPIPPAPALPPPVLAAPMRSAHVPSDDARSIRIWIAQLRANVRRLTEPLVARSRRSSREASVST